MLPSARVLDSPTPMSTVGESTPREAHAGSRPLARDRQRSIFEIALVLVLLLAQLWQAWRWLPLVAGHGRFARVLLSVAVVGVVAASLARAPIDLDGLGLAPRRWRHGWLSAAICSVASLLGIAIIAHVFGHPWQRLPHPAWIPGYVGGVLVQQFCLQSFVNNRLFEVSHGSAGRRAGTAVVGSSLLFSLVHSPNPGLMVASVLAASFWTWHFRRWLNLPCLVASHATLGMALKLSLGDGLLLHMRVGWGAARKLLAL